jgi:hypothetical protein
VLEVNEFVQQSGERFVSHRDADFIAVTPRHGNPVYSSPSGSTQGPPSADVRLVGGPQVSDNSFLSPALTSVSDHGIARHDRSSCAATRANRVVRCWLAKVLDGRGPASAGSPRY